MAHIPTWVVGLAVALVIAFAAWRAGSLSASGSVAAVVLGTAAMAAGWDWGVALIAYFVTSSLLSHFRAEYKARLLNGRIQKGGARDALQVLANGGAFGCAAIAFLVSGDEVWQLVATGALAASAADTWATEIGTLSRTPPRSILTWRQVEAGTSGGITLVGALAGVGGAVTVAVIVRLAGWPPAAALSAVAGGIVGCFFDSFLGGSLQTRRWCRVCNSATEQPIHRCGMGTEVTGGLRWLNNDGVNAMSTMVGALFGVMVAG